MRHALLGVAGTVGILCAAASAGAQTLLYSFETLYSNPNEPVPDPNGTLPDGFRPNGGGTVAQDTFGATDGVHSMRWGQSTNDTFTGALTALSTPFSIINATSTTAISVDLTVRAGEEFVGGFANMGITVFGENATLGEGSAQTVASAEQIVKLPAGTYRMFIPLIARNNPYTFELDVPFSSIVGTDPNSQMEATSFQFYINKGATTGPDPIPNAPLTAYLDNVRAVSAPTATWNTDADGDWSTSGNWLGLPQNVPDGVDAIAMFALGPPVSAARAVTLDQPRTVGTLYFHNPNGYTLTGPATLTMSVTTGQAGIRVNSGSHVVSVPLALNNDLNMTVVQPASVLTIDGTITAAGRTLTKSGAGRADVSPVTAAGLTINAGTVRLLPDGTAAGTSRVNQLSIAGNASPTATLDLTDNALVVDYGPADAEPFDTIEAQVRNAYNGGAWDQPGITSSLANAGQYGIGLAEAAELATVPAIFGTVDQTAVLLRFTRYGDANLDGLVNLADFNRLAGNFGATGANWNQGDFNYDGIVNLADFNRLAANFGLSAGPDGPTPQDWAALAAAVPEPSTAGMLAVGMTLLTRRRRRR